MAHEDVGEGKEPEFSISLSSLAEMERSITNILEPSAGKFELRQARSLDRSRWATIHGDLSGRNLTWSSDYEKLFLIDFEYVGPGFWGADQLKLISSIIGELADCIWTSTRSKTWAEATVAENTLSNITYAIIYYHQICNAVWRGNAIPSFISKSKRPEHNFIAELIEKIAETIGIDSRYDEKDFWSYSLFCFMYKQFEHSLDDIDDDCVRAIGNVLKGGKRTAPSDIISAVGESREQRLTKGRVAKLVYSFWGLLASIPSTGGITGQPRKTTPRRPARDAKAK